MFESLGRFMVRRRHLVLAGAGVFVAVAAVWGTGVFGSLAGAGFEDPDSDSARAAEQVKRVAEFRRASLSCENRDLAAIITGDAAR